MAPALFEDEYYDILRKARFGMRLDRPALAGKTGLTTGRINELEGQSASPTEPEIRTAAGALGLSPGKLADLALRPEPPREIHVRPPFVRLEVSANAYVIGDPASGKGFIVDPGGDASRIISAAERLGVEPVAILVTHGHGDHTGALDEVRARFPGALVVDRPTESLSAGALRGRARPVPGHTRDSLVFVFDEPAVAFTGDALFARSLGGAEDYPTLLGTVRAEILSLLPHTVLCPGHGPLSTVADELRLNPFFP